MSTPKRSIQDLLKGGATGIQCGTEDTSPFEWAIMRADVDDLEKALQWIIRNPYTHGYALFRQARIRKRLTELANAPTS